MACTLRLAYKSEIETIYLDPYLSKIAPDNAILAPINHPNAFYFSCYNDLNFCGVYLLIRQSKHEIELHSLLNREGVRYSRDFGALVLKQCFSDEAVLRVTGLIYSHLRKAVNYALKFNFKIEGFKRMASLKNGLPIGIYVLGLTRGDYERSR